jgi:hypothetical protein
MAKGGRSPFLKQQILVVAQKKIAPTQSQSSTHVNLWGNVYCEGNAYFASKIKRGPAKLGKDYGRIVIEER